MGANVPIELKSTFLNLLLIWILLWLPSCRAMGTKVRPLGGYERLLSRLSPGTKALSLSHACTVVLNKRVASEVLVQAVTAVAEKQPILRSCIERSKEGGYGWVYCEKAPSELAKDIVTTVQVDSLAEAWQAEMQASLNNAEFGEQSPQWRLTNIESLTSGKSAWVFCVNHAVDDQRSLNSVIVDLVTTCNSISSAKKVEKGVIGEALAFPDSMEDAMVQGAQAILPQTLAWAGFQLANSLRRPAMVPWFVSRGAKKKEARFQDPDQRSTFCAYMTLDSETVAKLRQRGRARGVTLTSLLSAAMLSITSTAIQTHGYEREVDSIVALPLRFLLSVDLRPYGSEVTKNKSECFARDWTGGAVACAAGAIDYVVKVPKEAAREEDEQIWMLAQRCQEASRRIVSDYKWVPESVRLFGFGMRYAQILRVVEADARSSSTLGRGFSCGVSNMGLANFTSPKVSSRDDAGTREPCVDLQAEQVYYATSHARNGVLCQLSCMSIDSGGSSPFYGTLQFTEPLTSRDDAGVMRDRLVTLLTRLADGQ